MSDADIETSDTQSAYSASSAGNSLKPPSYERRKSHTEAIKRETSHWIKQFLEKLYGHVDWSRAPLDRNKVDYCARVAFPLLFVLFIIIYVVVIMVGLKE